MQIEEQCPMCKNQSERPACQAGRLRVMKNSKEEFYKTLNCPLWGPKVDEAKLAILTVCPTCGQLLPGKIETPPPVPKKLGKRRFGDKRVRKPKEVIDGGSSTT